MIESSNIIESIRNKFESFNALYQESLQENKAILDENVELRRKFQEQENRFNELEKKYNKISLANAFEASSESTHEAKIKVNKIVREIDNCIALLNR